MLSKVPELSALHNQVKERCILDGELMVLKDGKPSFYEIQKRSIMTNVFKINLLSKQYPDVYKRQEQNRVPLGCSCPGEQNRVLLGLGRPGQNRILLRPSGRRERN